MKKLLTLVLVVALLTSCFAFTGCSKKLEGTYTLTKDTATVMSFAQGGSEDYGMVNYSMFGTMAEWLGLEQVNTLVFAKDGTYTLTKELHSTVEDFNGVNPNMKWSFVFHGEYEATKDGVTLLAPTSAESTITYTELLAAYLAGPWYNADANSTTNPEILGLFPTAYLIIGETNADVNIKLDDAAKTYALLLS